ncbi:ABC transporter permease [Pseudomonadota bacterium]
MKGALFLGWRYLAFHRFKATILTASITLMLFLPAATRLLVSDSAAALTARADQTPMIAGSKGSPLELALNSLYFHADQPPPMPFNLYRELRDSGLARAIPLHTRFHARNTPIVGTSLDYFSFRELQLASGRMIGMLGEAVLGANAAASQGLAVGDSIISSPETVFDIAGVYPLKMPIVGILEPRGTADDEAIFVDFKTTWVIQGLGHGHQDLEKPEARSAVLNRSDGMVTANASVMEFAEITAENIGNFHFHGANDEFPLNSVILLPPDEKSSTLLRGRYQKNDLGLQLIVPSEVLNALLDTVFTVQNYVVLGLIILGLATIAVIMLVFILSQQLRKGEFHTLSRIGASKSFIGTLIASEILFVTFFSVLLAFALTLAVRQYALQILQLFLSL